MIRKRWMRNWWKDVLFLSEEAVKGRMFTFADEGSFALIENTSFYLSGSM